MKPKPSKPFPVLLGNGVRALRNPAEDRKRGRLYTEQGLRIWVPPDAPPLAEMTTAVVIKERGRCGVYLKLLPPRHARGPVNYFMDLVPERGMRQVMRRLDPAGHVETHRASNGRRLVIGRLPVAEMPPLK